MKISSVSIARGLIEMCKSLPQEQYLDAVDAAISLLEKNRLTKEMRAFPRTVREVLQREQGILFASLTIPSGDASDVKESIVSVLEKNLKKTVKLSQHHDVSLIGGALLHVGDERFDASIRGALQTLSQQLSGV